MRSIIGAFLASAFVLLCSAACDEQRKPVGKPDWYLNMLTRSSNSLLEDISPDDATKMATRLGPRGLMLVSEAKSLKELQGILLDVQAYRADITRRGLSKDSAESVAAETREQGVQEIISNKSLRFDAPISVKKQAEASLEAAWQSQHVLHGGVHGNDANAAANNLKVWQENYAKKVAALENRREGNILFEPGQKPTMSYQKAAQIEQEIAEATRIAELMGTLEKATREGMSPEEILQRLDPETGDLMPHTVSTSRRSPPRGEQSRNKLCVLAHSSQRIWNN